MGRLLALGIAIATSACHTPREQPAPVDAGARWRATLDAYGVEKLSDQELEEMATNGLVAQDVKADAWTSLVRRLGRRGRVTVPVACGEKVFPIATRYVALEPNLGGAGDLVYSPDTFIVVALGDRVYVYFQRAERVISSVEDRALRDELDRALASGARYLQVSVPTPTLVGACPVLQLASPRFAGVFITPY
ncbi:MAG: hypothetical protein U0228_02395 [Myxococcaceae bacterium]